jgi:hypothetical protein
MPHKNLSLLVPPTCSTPLFRAIRVLVLCHEVLFTIRVVFVLHWPICTKVNSHKRFKITKNLTLFPSPLGILVIVSLLFLTPMFFYIPKAALAGLIIAAVVFMVEIKVVKPMWRSKSKNRFFFSS